MMDVYRVTLEDGQIFEMRANMSEASAPISVNFHGEDDTWQGTPYQTANANHIPRKAAGLVAEYFAADEDDCTTVERVDLVQTEVD